ncbi:MAG: recombinase family protein [Chloroflexi bacterium]|nr:recombinase family protein [Chloroflexota bacterium]
MTKRVAVYARVASEDQPAAQAMVDQIGCLHAYAREQGWSVAPEQVYQDNGCSGNQLARPALDRLRATIAQGEIDILLVSSPDRVARQIAEVERLLREWEHAGCQVIFVDFPDHQRDNWMRMLHL